MTLQVLQSVFSVSHELMSKFQCYLSLLSQWQVHTKLVSAAALSELWCRHIWDSAQLLPFLPRTTGQRTNTLVDIGSGAGFPGLVLAILGVPNVHLVEANARKGAFLYEASRVTETPVTIHISRVELLTTLKADVVTARAVASVDRLLTLTSPLLLGPESVALFLKGKKVEQELLEARKRWDMSICQLPSKSNPESGIILRLQDIRRRY